MLMSKQLGRESPVQGHNGLSQHGMTAGARGGCSLQTQNTPPWTDPGGLRRKKWGIVSILMLSMMSVINRSF